MYKTLSSLPRQLERDKSHSTSLRNFVLLNKNREVEQNYQWKPLRVKQAMMQRSNSLNKQISFGGSYLNKKSILLTLNRPSETQFLDSKISQKESPSKKSIDTQIFLRSKLNLNPKETESIVPNKQILNQTSIDFRQQVQKMESKLNKFTTTTAFFNNKVKKSIENFKISSMSTKISQNKTQNNGTNLSERIQQISSKGKRTIGILTMKRYGLRIRLKHAFSEVCMCENTFHQKEHELSQNKKINQLVREMLQMRELEEKPLYFFHLNKQPLFSSNQLQNSESIILASSSPILNIDNEFHFQIYEEAQKINTLINSIKEQLYLDMGDLPLNKKTSQKNFYQTQTKIKQNLRNNDESERDQTIEYDWEIISNIEDYVQQIVQNPEKLKAPTDSTIKKNPSLKYQIRSLYNEKFGTVITQQTGENFRNPLLEDHSHYHCELKQKKILSAISSKLQQREFIKNNHILKRTSIEALIEQDKRQKKKQLEDLKNPNIINRNIKKTLASKKSIMRQLDQKNTLLFEQNIPYLMEKYGINRYEIHNLFTIYKTLQKISGMKFRDKDNARKILKKGVDRSTFDEGMKRLDINPGDEVIKNICFFDDFISWQQFLKIVSIGLRKTPEQKLEAILFGIGGTNNGCLTKNQISIMIGNSLNKIFDSEQTELKEYFTEVAMRDLDGDGSGTVDVNEIKRKCLSVGKINLESGQNMDLITFLLLNS